METSSTVHAQHTLSFFQIGRLHLNFTAVELAGCEIFTKVIRTHDRLHIAQVVNGNGGHVNVLQH